jgi:hypothetical protein
VTIVCSFAHSLPTNAGKLCVEWRRRESAVPANKTWKSKLQLASLMARQASFPVGFVRYLRLLLLLLVSGTIGTGLTPAVGAPGEPSAVARAPARSKHSLPDLTPLVLYVATGEPNACGDGCSEWIAAEGSFDSGAAYRFGAFLRAQPGRSKLPIFFHSPGGLQTQALAIGRLMRERQMTAGVAKTRPTACTELPPDDKACLAVKRSRHKVAAALQTIDANCNSACVYALIGAKTRHVLPGSVLGVHSTKLVQVFADGRVRAPPSKDGGQLARFNTQLRDYVRQMGIDAALLDLAAKVPHEQVHRLTRDEIGRFGIDAQEFEETRWTVVEKQSQPPAVFKLIAQARGNGRKEFRNSVISLACGAADQVRTVYVRAVVADEVGTAKALKMVAGDHDWTFPSRAHVSKSTAIDPDGTVEARMGDVPLDFFEAAIAAPRIDIVEADSAAAVSKARVTSLSTHGLAQGLAILRQRCSDRGAKAGM